MHTETTRWNSYSAVICSKAICKSSLWSSKWKSVSAGCHQLVGAAANVTFCLCHQATCYWPNIHQLLGHNYNQLPVRRFGTHWQIRYTIQQSSLNVLGGTWKRISLTHIGDMSTLEVSSFHVILLYKLTFTYLLTYIQQNNLERHRAQTCKLRRSESPSSRDIEDSTARHLSRERQRSTPHWKKNNTSHRHVIANAFWSGETHHRTKVSKQASNKWHL